MQESMSSAFSIPDTLYFSIWDWLYCFAYGRTGSSKPHHAKLFFCKDFDITTILQKNWVNIKFKQKIYYNNKHLL
jgi:hypothetical protein